MTLARRLIITLLIALSLVILVFIALFLFFPRERIKGYIESRLASRLSEQVKLYIQSTSYIPPSRFVMKDVVIDDQKTALQEFHVKEVDFYINLFSVFRGESSISRILLKSPAINLIRTDAGNWNVEDIVETREEPAVTEGPPSFGPIVIRNGTVRIFQQDGEEMLSINDIAATIRPAENEILLKSASLTRYPLSAEFKGSVSDFLTKQPRIDVESKGEILREGSAGKGAGRSPRNQQVLTFTAKGKGPLDNVAVDGTFSVSRKLVSTMPINGSLQGSLAARKGALEVERLQTNIGDSVLTLSGAASDIWSEKRSANLSGNAQLLPEQILDALSESLAAHLEPDGVARGNVTVTAGMEKIDFTSELNIEPMGLTIPNVMRKQRGTPGVLTAEGSYAYGQALTIDTFNLTINGAPISGNAQVNSATQPWAQISFQATEFPLENLNRVPVVDFMSGVVTANGMVTKSTPDAKGIEYRTGATIANASVVGGNLKDPLREVDAELTLWNQNLRIRSAEFSFADSQYRAQVDLVDFSAPQIGGSLETNRMNLPAIKSAMKGKESEQKKEESTGALQNTTLNLIVKADSVYTGKFSTGPMFGTLHSSGQTYNFAPVTIDLFGGELRASSQFVSAKQQIKWEIDFEGAGIDLEKFLKNLQEGEPKLTGLLDIEGNLQGTASGNVDEALRSITGQVAATAKDGKVIRLPVLSTIINLTQIPVASLLIPGLREAVIANTLLNLFKTEGRSLDVSSVAYTSLKGNFTFSNGKASTSDLRFNSGMIDLISAGSINYTDKTVDFKVKATPLGALSSLISKIPIAGEPIRGAKEAVVATNFLVTGPLSNPEVRPALVEELLGGEKKPQGE